MRFFLKTWSRSVHDEGHHQQQHQGPEINTDGTSTSLTVWRKSLITSCNGFTVFNSKGDLAYRVDSYIDRPEELTLMDCSGKPIFTIHRRKKLGMLVDSWLVCEGEAGNPCTTNKESNKPVWCVRKQNNILLQSKHKVLAYVYRGKSEKRHAYVIEGSYVHRSCKVLDGSSRRVMAEIKRKEAMIDGISFGVEVFVLAVEPGFEAGFAMALVLLLDQMFS
uniref:Protein LURP-one-related 17 n=1 Tax=Rhizophora mucronata TaxID=61149 RepID=A0A2P2IWY4_RHIMU